MPDIMPLCADTAVNPDGACATPETAEMSPPFRAAGGLVRDVLERGLKVELSYDSTVKVPAGADAAIVAPTLVTSRSVQLAPAYNRGPVLPDGAVIPESRTAVPVEWDQVEQELDSLAKSLGPTRTGSPGALNRLLNTAGEPERPGAEPARHAHRAVPGDQDDLQ